MLKIIYLHHFFHRMLVLIIHITTAGYIVVSDVGESTVLLLVVWLLLWLVIFSPLPQMKVTRKAERISAASSEGVGGS